MGMLNRLAGGSSSKLALACVGALLMCAPASRAAVIVDDSWADGGRNDGADALDCNWWTSTASNAIEVSVGSMGLVSGTSGRGIHSTWTAQTLTNAGDSITATFTFKTPATVGNNLTNALRVGFFSSLGNAALAANLSASTGTPNPLYDPLPGYLSAFDVNSSPANVDIRRKQTTGTVGQLMSTTNNYDALGSGGSTYAIAANTVYTGTLSITKTATGADITSSLSNASGLLSSFTVSDTTPPSPLTFDMLAFQTTSNAFGSSATVNAADNGIDFSNVKIETAVPEPTSLTVLCLLPAVLRQRR